MKSILKTIPMLGWNSLVRIRRFLRDREGELWLAGVIAAVLVGGILSWQFWVKLGGHSESFSTTLRNIAIVLGGVAAILLAVWRSRVSERQTDIAS